MTQGTSRFGVYLRLGRVSNLPTVWTNVLAGIALGGGSLEPLPVLGLGLGASSAYVGGMFLNDAFDRHIDARERPERPIPSGTIGASEVFAVGFGLLGVAVALIVGVTAAVSPDRLAASALAATALVACIVLYDAWHKQNPLSTVIMGLCRGAVYASSAIASGGALTAPLMTGAVALIAYVVGLTAVARQENRRRFEGAWPLLLLAAPVGVAASGRLGGAELVALFCFVVWVAAAAAPLYRRGDVNVPRAVVRLIAGISLLDGMMAAAHGSVVLALCGGVGLAATLVFQRWVRGT